MESTFLDGKRKRAQKACQFCHQRKLKCNNEHPTCSNCVTHGKACTYAQGPKRPRPSNDRISRLEEENRQLHASLAGVTPSHDQEAQGSARTSKMSTRRMSREGDTHPVAHASNTDDESTAEGNSPPNSMRADALKNIEFHGPSSVLFDDNGPITAHTQDLNAGEQLLQPTSSKLMANAATQRRCTSCTLESSNIDRQTLTCTLV